MKIIITGATGLVGNEVLSQCLSNPQISSIIVLSRRPLPTNLSLPRGSGSAKPGYEENRSEVRLKTLHLKGKEWEHLPQGVLRECEGAVGCIWAIGGPVDEFPSLEIARLVNVDYPVAAAKGFVERESVQAWAMDVSKRRGSAVEEKSEEGTFRFCYVSGHGIERDVEKAKHLHIFKDTRSMKGETESQLLALSKAHKGFQTCFARPGGVLPVGSTTTKVFGGVMGGLGIAPSLGVEELAAACIDWVINGWEIEGVEGEGVVGNAELKKRGKEALWARENSSS